MSKPYSELNTIERWEWHARVYAFRRVVLGVPIDVRTSPCDEKGDWFDGRLVDDHERIMRSRYSEIALRCKKSRPDYKSEHEIMLEAMDIENNWAKDRGFRDFQDYKDQERIDHVEACVRLIKSLPGFKRIPGDGRDMVDDPRSVAEALVVRAKERVYTAEELRRGRIALGLEQPEQEAAAE